MTIRVQILIFFLILKLVLSKLDQQFVNIGSKMLVFDVNINQRNLIKNDNFSMINQYDEVSTYNNDDFLSLEINKWYLIGISNSNMVN